MLLSLSLSFPLSLPFDGAHERGQSSRDELCVTWMCLEAAGSAPLLRFRVQVYGIRVVNLHRYTCAFNVRRINSNATLLGL